MPDPAPAPPSPEPSSVSAPRAGGIRALGQFSDLLRRLQSRLWQWEAEYRGAEVRGPVAFLGRPVITIVPGSRMIFGGDNEIFSDVRCTALGNIQPCVLRTMSPQARLELGKGVGMSGVTICSAASVIIGEGTIIGAGTLIFDTDFHRPVGEVSWDHTAAATAKPIQIGRGCLIGARVLIMKGVTLGDRCAVAGGAVVTSNVPSGTVAIGNPARMMPWSAGEAALRSAPPA